MLGEETSLMDGPLATAFPGTPDPLGLSLVPSQTDEVPEAVRKQVELWTQRIRDARDKWDSDYKRMRKNMEYTAGLQWPGQETISDVSRYINNRVLRAVNQKVASLYARNPEVEAVKQERLDFEIWTGDMAEIEQCVMRIQQSMQVGMQPSLQDQALYQDYQEGTARQRLIEKLCKTLVIIYGWQINVQDPEFKQQMKQLVRRVVTCGVGYVKQNFVSSGDSPLSVESPGVNKLDTLKRIQNLVREALDENAADDDVRMLTVRQLSASLGNENTLEQTGVPRLIYNFPAATNVIPDERCTCLNGFLGAGWVAEQFILSLEEVNAFFKTNVKSGGKIVDYGKDGQEMKNGACDDASKKFVCVFEVQNKIEKNRFFLLDGHEDFLSPPTPVEIVSRRFWTLFPLTFNTVEVEEGLEVTIFPPSDVDLLRSAQNSHNASRDGLKEHRKQNIPRWATGDGWLEEDDVNKLINAEDHSVVKLKVPPGTNIGQMIVAVPSAPIDPSLYDTNPSDSDFLAAVGMQEANLGPAQSNVTATVGTIAEQSRLSGNSSNVDDLDSLLSDLAQAGGELLLQGMSAEHVVQIAGRGAVWPTTAEDRRDCQNEVLLQMVASSSGRPNKVLDINNFKELAPIWLQAGINPKFIVEEGIRRYDDRLDVTKAFPLVPVAPPAGGANMLSQTPGDKAPSSVAQKPPNPQNQGM
jgi:hypothetical protein